MIKKIFLFVIILLSCDSCSMRDLINERELPNSIFNDPMGYWNEPAISFDGKYIINLFVNSKGKSNIPTTDILLYTWIDNQYILTDQKTENGGFHISNEILENSFSPSGQRSIISGLVTPKMKVADTIRLLILDNNKITLKNIDWPYSKDPIIYYAWSSDGKYAIFFDGGTLIITDSNGNMMREIHLEINEFTQIAFWANDSSIFISGVSYLENKKGTNIVMEIPIEENGVTSNILYRCNEYYFPIGLNKEKTKLLYVRSLPSGKIDNVELEIINLKNLGINKINVGDFKFGKAISNNENLLGLGDWSGKKIIIFDWETERVTTLVDDAFLIGWDKNKNSFSYIFLENDAWKFSIK